MLLRGLGMPRADRSVVVLGAGASRGASFCKPGVQVLPPLDADFFRQAQQLDEATYKRYGRPVLDFLRADYPANNLPTLETVFTEVEGFERFLRQFSARRGRPSTRYQKQLGHLQALIPAVFRAAFESATCDWHDRMARALRSGDAVISFNYDTLIDDALRRNSDGIWSAKCGYGFDIDQGTVEWSARVRPGPFPSEYLRLLKPHGSLHWIKIKEDQQELTLRSNPYVQTPARNNIIPPTWDKTILSRWPWKPVWEECSNFLEDVRCLIVIGYSVPTTDLMTQALIKSSPSRATLRLLVIVNPDEAARRRVATLARPAIRSNTRIIEMATLQEFGRTFDETPDERRRRAAETARLRRAIRDVQGEVSEIEDKLDIWEVEEHDDRLTELDRRIDELERRFE
jgi:hypothetical protein